MQSTPNPNFDDGFDKLFTDKAWENMNALLDQEMPIEKKRKRGFLIWWNTGYAKCIAASLVILLGMGMWRVCRNVPSSYNNNSIDTTQNAMNQSGVSTTNNAIAQYPNHINQLPTNITASKHGHENDTLHTETRFGKLTAIAKQQRNHEIITMNRSAPSVLLLYNDPDVLPITQKNVDTSVVPPDSPMENNTQKSILANITGQTYIRILPALPLALLEMMPIDDYLYANIPTTLPQKPSWWKRNTKIGISSIFNVRNALMGGEVGVATTFRLSNKTSISVGLSGMRRSYRVALPDSSSTIIPNVKITPAISQDSNTTYFASDITINSLQLPIVFSRSMGNNWSIGAGVTPIFNLAQTNSLATAIQAQNIPTTKSISNNTPIADNSTQVDWYIKDMPTRPFNQNSAEMQYFYSNQIHHNLRQFNILSGLYAGYALEKLNIVASVEYNLLGYNIYTNTGHSLIVKVGIERSF